MGKVEFPIQAVECRNAVADGLEVQEFGFVAVIQIGAVVGDFIGHIDQLRLQRGLQIQQVFPQFLVALPVILPRMLDDPLPYLEGQVQAGKCDVSFLQLLHDSQGVQVVVETLPVGLHQTVKQGFPRMAERRMAQVVNQRQGFHQVGIQPQSQRHGAADLCDFERMRQAVAKMVGVAAGENLRLVFEAPKGTCMDDAVPVPFKVIPVGVGRLPIPAAAALLHPHGIAGQLFSRPRRHGSSQRDSI